MNAGRLSFLHKEKNKLFQFSEIPQNHIKQIVDLLKSIQTNKPIVNQRALRPIQETQLRVTRRSEFPVTKTLPSGLVKVAYLNLNLKTFDKRLLPLEHLSVLQISHNAIKTIPYEFYNLGLESVDFSDNYLSEMPQMYGKEKICQTLKVLDLSRNKLTELPENFWLLEALVKVDVSQNDMQSLPAAYFNRHSSGLELIIDKNPIQILPQAILNGIGLISNFKIDLRRHVDPLESEDLIKNLRGEMNSLLRLTNLASKKLMKKGSDKLPELTSWLATKLNVRRKCSVCYELSGIEPFRYPRDVTERFMSLTKTQIGCDEKICAMEYICSYNCALKYCRSPWKFK